MTEKLTGWETVLERSGSDSPFTRSGAAIQLGTMHGAQAYEHLKKLMEDKELYVRCDAVLGMGYSKDSRAFFCLINYFNNAPFEIQKRVVLALEQLSDPRAYEFFEQILEGEYNTFLKRLAAGAKKKINFEKPFLYTADVEESKLELALHAGGQIKIQSGSDLDSCVSVLEDDLTWVFDKPQTYIVTPEECFFIGGTLNEHVFVARGNTVIAAGEVSFIKNDGVWSVDYINNRSSAYYPDTRSFCHVKKSLAGSGILLPDNFTEPFPINGYLDDDFLSLKQFYNYFASLQRK